MFGLGYSPIAPGTVGSLFAVIIYWLCPELNHLTFLSFILLLFFVGVYTSTATENYLIKKLGIGQGHDPSLIIIDEVVGMLVALIAIPKTYHFIIAAFILFRIFDIVKPFPVNLSQKLPQGWGIMIDDLLAGIYANLLIQLFIIIY